MKADENVYAVAYIKTLENKNLTNNDLNELIYTDDAEAFVDLLEHKGYKGIKKQNFNQGLSDELKKTVEEVRTVCDGEFLKFYLYKNDFHNIKTLIKAGKNCDALLIEPSFIDVELLKTCIENNNYNQLPKEVAEGIIRGKQLLENTSDPQQADIFLDTFLLKLLSDTAKRLKNNFFLGWVILNADIINMKILSRTVGRNEEFIKNALIKFGNINNVYFRTAEEVSDFFADIGYDGAAAALEKSVTEFEKWCDNLKINYVRKEKNNYFGVEPIFSFLVLKEYEIQALRIIYYAKKNRTSHEEIKERLRDFYG